MQVAAQDQMAERVVVVSKFFPPLKAGGGQWWWRLWMEVLRTLLRFGESEFEKWSLYGFKSQTPEQQKEGRRKEARHRIFAVTTN